MKDPKKAKWLLGTSGVILSALLLTQMDSTTTSQAATTDSPLNQFSVDEKATMTDKEQELVQLDWTNFEVQTVTQTQQPVQSDRQSRRT